MFLQSNQKLWGHETFIINMNHAVELQLDDFFLLFTDQLNQINYTVIAS